jgi:competence protein ComEA
MEVAAMEGDTYVDMRDSCLPWYRQPRRLLALICAIVGGFLIAFGPELRAVVSSPEAPLLEESTLSLPTPTVALTVVYVSGAVAAPDVYRLPFNARVIDALQAAGGLIAEADISGLNLAAPVRDGDHIRVPFVGETVLSLPANDQSGAGLLNLNQASAADLEELPGIGAALAARIIERRNTKGPYQSIDELREVRGIGEKLFAQIAPLVTVGP